MSKIQNYDQCVKFLKKNNVVCEGCGGKLEPIEIDNYRVDFLIYTNTDKYWMSKEFSYPQYNKKNSLIIEIDSYLWHGSTPEQFAKEKERERYLQKNGWIMHRYSGSEIYKNVEKCVEEELEYIVNIETEILTQELNKIEKEGIYDSK